MKKLLLALGFIPKENTSNIFIKKFPLHNNYALEVDFEKEVFHFGGAIKIYDKDIQNITKPEDWVVFECVNRLLEKGYKPENIILEKIFPSGHGTSGRLDILVKREGKEGKSYLMIECKTWGKEFDKEWQNTQKHGGQLFTYFQQDRDTEFLMLYASELDGKDIQMRNEIIKIEPDYRLMGNVVDLYNRWNKFTKQNGIFESWSRAYHFESKAMTLGDLAEIRQEDSSTIFNRFLEILRHNAVSDKPNAFNKIFTLFLCKIKDEDKQGNEELDFQWKEGEDTAISFQKRLSDLYKLGMNDFLKKKISDISDKDFNGKYAHLNEADRMSILDEITKIRLQKNNEFAIKEVFDEETFQENGKVLKEVVELLQGYRFRYAKKQPFLGEFFELLLTTGLKQEAGQFFTPVPIARFICKSIPMRAITEKKLKSGSGEELLPNIIDYAAGSGHFLTEAMEELQNTINALDIASFAPSVRNKLRTWKDDTFSWAEEYVYGIELDYRLVKTTKVGCYLHGDGVANVIHGDGLDSFTQSNYTDKLTKKIPGTQDNGQFDFVLSNPPYSVSACKGNLKNRSADKDFVLYGALTDQSSQIESLFIERTKQLLTEGGIAAIILPSSILSNGGIYTKTREILLKYFEFVAIVELGSGTFMATGTNTVILFLRRRSNYDASYIEEAIRTFFTNHKDNTINAIESPFSRYVSHVWGEITLDDYISLISGEPSESAKSHEIYIDYQKKIKSKNPKEWLAQVITLEREKILYYILAYGQEIVLVKSGDRSDEKSFLGYEFSNSKGKEGIHSIKKGKMIDECTLLFDAFDIENPERVNTYILDAFAGKYDRVIAKNLEKYISRANVVDMLVFDRSDYDKSLNLNSKKKVNFSSKFESSILENLVSFQSGLWKGEKGPLQMVKVLRNTNFNLNNGKLSYEDIAEIEVESKQLESRKLDYGDIILEKSGGSDTQAIGRVALFDKRSNELFSYSNFCSRIRVIDPGQAHPLYIAHILNDFYNKGGTVPLQNGVRLLNIDMEGYKKIKIPLPPLNIQQQIVDEMEILEQRERENKENVERFKNSIGLLLPKNIASIKVDDIALMLKRGKSPKYGDSHIQIIKSGQARGVRTFDFAERHFVDASFVLDERKIEKGDILINSTGVGTAGRVTLFDLDGDFVVDTHITILRLDRSRAIPIYILSYFVDFGFKNIEALALGQSGQIELSIETIKNLKIPLPPLSEQQRIVMEIEQIEGKIAELELELASIPAQKEAILKKYL